MLGRRHSRGVSLGAPRAALQSSPGLPSHLRRLPLRHHRPKCSQPLSSTLWATNARLISPGPFPVPPVSCPLVSRGQRYPVQFLLRLLSPILATSPPLLLHRTCLLSVKLVRHSLKPCHQRRIFLSAVPPRWPLKLTANLSSLLSSTVSPLAPKPLWPPTPYHAKQLLHLQLTPRVNPNKPRLVSNRWNHSRPSPILLNKTKAKATKLHLNRHQLPRPPHPPSKPNCLHVNSAV